MISSRCPVGQVLTGRKRGRAAAAVAAIGSIDLDSLDHQSAYVAGDPGTDAALMNCSRAWLLGCEAGRLVRRAAQMGRCDPKR